MKWRRDGDAEWELDKRTGKLIPKGKGPMEENTDGIKTKQLRKISFRKVLIG